MGTEQQGELGAFVWNGSYQDCEQVERYYAAFRNLRDREGLSYGRDFRGRIPPLSGPDEDRAIYLLQRLDRRRRHEEQLSELLDSGYHELQRQENLRGETIQAASIYHCGDQGQFLRHYRQARVIFNEAGKPVFIWPPGLQPVGHAVVPGDRLLARPPR